ncbi:MAG: family 20 glycosylhydrolase [Bacteroidales bacterium]|jgi:hexosaminidase|nr:family 20 glycosylhydrolase [Bacteroidales bacterium]
MKNNYTLIFALLISLISLTACQQSKPKKDITIIPAPEFVFASNKSLEINKDTRVIYEDPNPALRLMGEQLANFISEKSDFRPVVIPFSKVQSLKNDIFLAINLNDSTFGDEGYRIHNPDGQLLSIQANDARGVFYGIQSVYQLFPSIFFEANEKQSTWEIPLVTISDKARFAYRGMHLDVSRHFFPVEFIKQYIDLLAMYKYNTFHWHLTEDQGWRIEIKAYPKLTEVGSWREETKIGHQWETPKQFDGTRYGGFYTQDEVREIVDYAASKYITVIPEIEMPGHAMAALAAYPELGCTGGPYAVQGEWGVFDDIYCSRESTFVFLENVLAEVIEMFPSKYIHIGGDEAPKTRWEACPDCQKRIRDEKLEDEAQLQSYFITRISKFLEKHERQIIGWDEILEGGLSPGATVMSWRGTAGGIAAAHKGHDVIMTPASHCYFDHYQAEPSTEPLAIGGFTPISKVYDYEPIPEELNTKEAKHILGAQANVWTEYIVDNDGVTYMILPRMAALSEVLWSPAKNRDWESFYDRLPAHFVRYDALGLNYSKAVNQVKTKLVLAETADTLVELTSEVPQVKLFYTTDGSIPDENSRLYTEKLKLGRADQLKVQLYRNGEAIGETQSPAIK